MLTHFSTFSGIGGLDLAAEMAGFITVGQVEKADFPYQVLIKHWPNVPKWRDIHDVTSETVRSAGIEAITVLSGGFPCQPFSSAGKKRGKADDRYLWPEMLRLVQQLRPHWVIGENVAGIVHMELDNVLSGLENEGYATRAFIIPSAGVGAPHIRERVFIVAHDERKRGPLREVKEVRVERTESALDENLPCIKDIAGREQSQQFHVSGDGRQLESLSWDSFGWPEAATRFCGVDDGISDRVDRLRALGNAVVPQQAYPIFRAIAELEG